MRVCVAVSNKAYLAQAGVRIRYQRIQAHFRSRGWVFDIEEVGLLTKERIVKYDSVIISKIYDVRAIVLARSVSSMAKLVGVDLFDDYFSQDDDARFCRLRDWLARILNVADFALCSTDRMKVVALDYKLLPCHVLNDPAELELCESNFKKIVAKKANQLTSARELRILWFGIGSNPHFPVGIHDLAAFGASLGYLVDSNYLIRLDILTNANSLPLNLMAQLKNLPVSYRLFEWTLELETELLERANVCFIPVNFQAFSRAKSLNRAVTALAFGCQLLSPGFGLYEAFDDLIYRDSAEFKRDLVAADFKVSNQHFDRVQALFQQHADSRVEFRALANFLFGQALDRVLPALDKPPLMLVVLHGRKTLGDGHKYVRKMGGYSVASPYCDARLNFDIRFVRSDDGGVVCLVSDKQVAQLAKLTSVNTRAYGKILDTNYIAVASEFWSFIPRTNLSGSDIVTFLADFGSAVEVCTKMLEELLPNCYVVVSELTELPWQLTCLETL